MKNNLLDRFLRYVTYDTQSDPSSDNYPSTRGQLVLLGVLADELRAMGAAEVAMDPSWGYVTATIPAIEGYETEPTIGFVAHVDTSPDAPGANVRPQITETANDTIITSDGTTLLGADDKAGVAIIMTATEWLVTHPEAPHGKVRIAFTPDEEIGRGVDHFDVAAFGANFAYTLDGGREGELEYENFNAAGAQVTIRGVAAHPGDAQGKMTNAVRVAVEFDGAITPSERPETTSGREGFYHLMRLDGTVEGAQMEYIIRDHDSAIFEERKERLAGIAALLDAKYGAGTVRVEVTDQYRNMAEVVMRHPEIVERAARAMRAAGVEPVMRPIRGGTDGARLSWMGLPCPNLFTGGENFHSLTEKVSLGAMERAVRTVVGIASVEPY